MKILVTGGAGFIGSHTVDALLEKGHDIRILDNLQKPVHLKGRPAWIPDDAEFLLGDVRDKGMWEKCLEGVDAVYHFAAYQDYLPDFSTFFHVNAVSTALLYEAAVEKGMELAKVVVASSQFVQGEGLYGCRNLDCGLRNEGFQGVIRPEGQLKQGQWEMLCPECGAPGKWKWTPETHAAPPNAYAMAKYSQEMQAMTFGRRYGIPSVALRYSIVQGPRQSFYNAYSGACRIFSLSYYFGKAPTLYEDGLQCRDFVNIHDVVRANVMALEDGRMDYGVFNVGGGRAYTVQAFAEIVREQMSDVRGQKSGELPEAKVPGLYRFGDTRNACSDISKIRGLGWEPEMTPKDSVQEYVEWLYAQDNVEDILAYAEKTMKDMDVVRKADG
ncbi:MAG: NAD-dependent epimerase/dehydratase family protein [Deltaproteobacteria bacterium]|jgi:dTDP-L-rhamnose 4-epimerase|nr:NAD-dependent epimerase/dehydratase family protein [Deltaproteobacteria bacterium]